MVKIEGERESKSDFIVTSNMNKLQKIIKTKMVCREIVETTIHQNNMKIWQMMIFAIKSI